MSENKFLGTTRSVADVVDNMLDKGYRLSLVYNNSYHLYTYDKVPVFISSGYSDATGEHTESALQVLNIPNLAGVHLDEEFCEHIRFQIVQACKKISLDSINEKSLFANVIKESQNKKYNKINKEDIVEHLVYYMINGLKSPICPIDVIKRNFYFFDKPGAKPENYPYAFNAMNHDSKLVEYKTDRGNYWFFTGEKSTGKFMPMDAESQQIFNAVKIALQKQKQNVK